MRSVGGCSSPFVRPWVHRWKTTGLWCNVLAMHHIQGITTLDQYQNYEVVRFGDRGMQLLFSLLLPSALRHCWLGARKSIWSVKIEWWGVGMVICRERGADCLHIVQLMPLQPKIPSSVHLETQSPLASVKSGLILPFWYRLTQVVLEKRPLNMCNFAHTIHLFAAVSKHAANDAKF